MFYTYVDGKCYSYSCHTTLTWENARQMCQDEGGDLTYFETEAEMITVFYWLKKSNNAGGDSVSKHHLTSIGYPIV